MIGTHLDTKVATMCFRHAIVLMDAVPDVAVEASAVPEVATLEPWKPKSSRGLNNKELVPPEDVVEGTDAVLDVELMGVVIDCWGR